MDRDQNAKCLLAQKLKRYSLFQCIGRICSSTDILLQFLPLGHSIQVNGIFSFHFVVSQNLALKRTESILDCITVTVMIIFPPTPIYNKLVKIRPDVYSRDIMLAVSQSLGMFENLQDDFNRSSDVKTLNKRAFDSQIFSKVNLIGRRSKG